MTNRSETSPEQQVFNKLSGKRVWQGQVHEIVMSILGTEDEVEAARFVQNLITKNVLRIVASRNNQGDVLLVTKKKP